MIRAPRPLKLALLGTPLTLALTAAMVWAPMARAQLFNDIGPASGTNLAANSQWGAGVAFRDADDDGDIDLYAVDGQGDPNCFFRNDGGATFTEIAGTLGLQNTEWGKSFIPVDFDNDGDADLLLTNYAGNQLNRLYRNDAGTYTDITAGSGFDFADYCTGAAWADYDNDGLLDCYITGYEVSHKNRLMRNLGGGVFVDVAPALGVNDETGWGYQPAWFDYDNDGDQDLYIGNDDFFAGPPNRLYRNDGGIFTDVSVASGADVSISTMGIAVGDYDNDLDLDLYMSHINLGNVLLQNNGDGTFTDVAPTAGVEAFVIGWGTDFFDYDNDGHLDLYLCVMNETFMDPPGATNFLWHSDGDGTFTDVSSTSGTDNAGVSFSSAVGDIDLDGDLDLYVSNWFNGTPIPNSLYENQYVSGGATATDFLRVNLVGTVSNRDAVGARVTITTASGQQMRERQCGTSYLSSSEPTMHFGLGSDTMVTELTVRWPSGIVETYTDIPAGQIVTYFEGATTSAGTPLANGVWRLEAGPNPFRGMTQIRLAGGLDATPDLAPIGTRNWQVDLFDATGARIRRLSESMTPEMVLHWDGTDGAGRQVPAGTYYLRLATPGAAPGAVSTKVVRVR